MIHKNYDSINIPEIILGLMCHCFLKTKAYVTWTVFHAKLTTNYWGDKIFRQTQEAVFDRFLINVSEKSEDL